MASYDHSSVAEDTADTAEEDPGIDGEVSCSFCRVLLEAFRVCGLVFFDHALSFSSAFFLTASFLLAASSLSFFFCSLSAFLLAFSSNSLFFSFC